MGGDAKGAIARPLARHNVSSVGLLKVDTEGFDTQALRPASPPSYPACNRGSPTHLLERAPQSNGDPRKLPSPAVASVPAPLPRGRGARRRVAPRLFPELPSHPRPARRSCGRCWPGARSRGSGRGPRLRSARARERERARVSYGSESESGRARSTPSGAGGSAPGRAPSAGAVGTSVFWGPTRA